MLPLYLETDSAAEEMGFEPSVPRRIDDAFETALFASAALPVLQRRVSVSRMQRRDDAKAVCEQIEPGPLGRQPLSGVQEHRQPAQGFGLSAANLAAPRERYHGSL